MKYGKTKERTSHLKKKSITIDSNLEEKLREIQSQLIGITKRSWSLSAIINLSIAAGLLAADKLSKDDWSKIKSIMEGRVVTIDNKKIRYFVSIIARE